MNDISDQRTLFRKRKPNTWCTPTPGSSFHISILSHGFDLQQQPDNQLFILILILSENSSTFPGSSLVCICPIGPSDPARDNSQRALSKICQDKGKETCSKVRDMCGQLRLRCMRAASFSPDNKVYSGARPRPRWRKHSLAIVQAGWSAQSPRYLVGF